MTLKFLTLFLAFSHPIIIDFHYNITCMRSIFILKKKMMRSLLKHWLISAGDSNGWRDIRSYEGLWYERFMRRLFLNFLYFRNSFIIVLSYIIYFWVLYCKAEKKELKRDFYLTWRFCWKKEALMMSLNWRWNYIKARIY